MLRDHLNAAERATGRRPAGLETPELPRSIAYLMQWFRMLSLRRPAGMSGPVAIAFGEIESWSRLQHIVLQPWQVTAVTHLDDLWRAAWFHGRKDNKPQGNAGSKRRRAKR